MPHHRIGLVGILVLSLYAVSFGSVPYLISYQGSLADTLGVPLPAGSNRTLTFTIYDSSVQGTAYWSEQQSVHIGAGGQFKVLLGSIVPLSDNLFSSIDRYLGVAVDADPEMKPRHRIVSSAYAIRIGSVDGSAGGRITGPVSIGNTDLKSQLTLGGGLDLPFTASEPANNAGGIRWMNGFDSHSAFGLFVNGGLWYQGGGDGTNSTFGVRSPKTDGSLGNVLLAVKSDGNVGIGTESPSTRLHVSTKTLYDQGFSFGICVSDSSDPAKRLNLGFDANLNAGVIQSSQESVTWNRNLLLNPKGGSVGIGTTSPRNELDVVGTIQCSNKILTPELQASGNVEVQGRTKTGTLEITGGADLAEPFNVSDESMVTAGAVVIIDEENPGKLKLSDKEYDTRVAGVISGAGGIKPGLTLKQSGLLDSGQNVALSGRVNVFATAANGSIKPGDLLTTSDVPGRAMKATDRERSQGSVIGKAMTGLDRGEGLIMVLVNLQ